MSDTDYKCIYCGHDKGNASMLCGGTGSNGHSFPKPPTVTISRESLDKLIADWRQMAAFVKSDGHGVSSAYDNCADELTKAMEVKGE